MWQINLNYLVIYHVFHSCWHRRHHMLTLAKNDSCGGSLGICVCMFALAKMLVDVCKPSDLELIHVCPISTILSGPKTSQIASFDGVSWSNYGIELFP